MVGREEVVGRRGREGGGRREVVGREEVGGKEEVGGREQMGGREEGGRGSLWTRLKENEMHLCCHSFCLVALFVWHCIVSKCYVMPSPLGCL